MVSPPFIVESGGTFALDTAVRAGGRKQFTLSDRATSLLVDELGYGNRDVVPTTTVRTLALAGGICQTDERTGPLDLTWSLSDVDGGRRVPEAELRALARYLEAVVVDDRAVEALREQVRTTRLSSFTTPDRVTGTGRQTSRLRDIARDSRE